MSELTLDQLPSLRELTGRVSDFLERRLRGHLDTLQPLLGPRRLLSKHVRSIGGLEGTGGQRAFEELRTQYGEIAGRPYGLGTELPENPLELESKLDLYPWEYTLQVRDQVITMTSPVRWILAYRCPYTPAQLRKTLATGSDRRPEDIRQFVVGMLVLAQLLRSYSGISSLLGELRFAICVEPCDGLGPLPIVSIRAGVTSIRPADELILTATQFSGIPAFIELISPEQVGLLADPLQEDLGKLIRA